MNRAILWERLKNIIDSCITHEHCDVCRNMLELAAYDLMALKKFKDDGTLVDYFNNTDGSYYSDLSRRIVEKRRTIEDIEDLKLLEKMNAKNKETTS